MLNRFSRRRKYLLVVLIAALYLTIYTQLESKVELKYEEEIPVYKDFINFHEDIDNRFRSNEILQYEDKDNEKKDKVLLEGGENSHERLDDLEDENNEIVDFDEEYDKKENGGDYESQEKEEDEIFEGGESKNEVLNDVGNEIDKIDDFNDQESKEEPDETESDLDNPEDYDSSGCPVVPFAFSGMTGRLGNVMSTYINFIALQWKLGYKYFLPKYMNHHSWADPTKPYFESIFKNVSFPEATWSNITDVARDASDNAVIRFNNSRTNYEEKSCEKHYARLSNVEPFFSDSQKCAEEHGCEGQSCLYCSGGCPCTNIWVTIATGANYPDFGFIGSVLDDIIKYHLQFTENVNNQAKDVIKSVAKAFDSLEDMVYIGVHVRRTDFHEFSKFWINSLVNETYFEAAMDHFRSKHPHVVFLVVSDDMDWCKEHLTSTDTLHIGGTSPEVDMAVMANCNGSIIDYGTFGLWGAALSGGEVVVTSQTFRDVRWAADHFGWKYI